MSPAIRLSALYGGIFLILGIIMPFWPVWLKAKGLSPSEIGIVLAAGSAFRVLVSPLVANVCDRTGERKRPIVLLSVLTLLTFVPFGLAEGFLAILVLQALFAGVSGPINPLAETLTMLGAKRHGLDYGRIRLWGSITFILSASGIGFFLKGAPADAIYGAIIGTIVVLLLASMFIPDFRAQAADKGSSLFSRVLRDRTFLAFILATTCIQGSHAVMYGFGTLNWQRIGLGEDVIGMLWAEGVIAEVVLFIWGAKVLRHVGPARLIALAGLAGLIRWSCMGVAESLPAMVLLQLLHAFTFGAAHLGAIHFIAQRMPEDVSATAQTIYGLFVAGLGVGMTMLASGYVYEAFKGQAFFAMAVMSATGMVVAWQIRRR